MTSAQAKGEPTHATPYNARRRVERTCGTRARDSRTEPSLRGRLRKIRCMVLVSPVVRSASLDRSGTVPTLPARAAPRPLPEITRRAGQARTEPAFVFPTTLLEFPHCSRQPFRQLEQSRYLAQAIILHPISALHLPARSPGRSSSLRSVNGLMAERRVTQETGRPGRTGPGYVHSLYPQWPATQALISNLRSSRPDTGPCRTKISTDASGAKSINHGSQCAHPRRFRQAQVRGWITDPGRSSPSPSGPLLGHAPIQHALGHHIMSARTGNGYVRKDETTL
jgi:hypothetical protein